MFSPQGPAGAFALYTTGHLPRVFLNEFVSVSFSFSSQCSRLKFAQDFFLGLVIWAALDPTNFFAPPVLGPFIIAGAYAAVIWG